MTQEIILAGSSSSLGLGFIGWIIIGGFAGYFAGKVKNGTGFGAVMNIAIGILGGVFGGWIVSIFGGNAGNFGLIFSFLTCFLGALLLLWIVGKLSNK